MSIIVSRGQPPNGDGSAPGNLSSDSDAWWWSSSGIAARWGIVAAIFVVFLLCIGAAYMHAQKRMKKGLQPLPYHRWLVRRHQRAQFAPQYDMQPYAPRYSAPPPAYNTEHDYVPAYSPPADGTKIKMKDETTVTEGGPSQPPPVANPSRPTYS